MVRVWDVPVRVLHVALVITVGLAWITTEVAVGWHQRLGWTALGVIAARLAWSRCGNRHARLGNFVRGPRTTLNYAWLALRARAPRYVGHNPLGAWMVLALFACVATLALTGWLYTTDRFWGDAVVERVHVGAAWGMGVLVALHVLGAIAASVRHRENLIASMAHGMKREAHGSDID